MFLKYTSLFYAFTLFIGKTLPLISVNTNWSKLGTHSSDSGDFEVLFLILSATIFIYSLAERFYKISFLGIKVFVDHIRKSRYVTNKASTIAYSLFGLSIVTLAYTYDFTGLFYREEYIPTANKLLKSVGLILCILTFLFLTVKRRENSQFVILSLLVLLLFLSISSRFIVVVPIAILLRQLGDRWWYNFCVLLLMIATTVLLMVVVIDGRRSELHGLIPYLTNIMNEGISIELALFTLHYIFTYSLDAIKLVINQYSYSSIYFWSSINPLPASWIAFNDWSALRINSSQPFPAVAELWLFSPMALAIYYFVSYLSFGLLEKYAIKMRLLPLVIINLSVGMLFTFYMLQYNLRQANRLLTLTIFALLIIFLMKFLNEKFPKKKR